MQVLEFPKLGIELTLNPVAFSIGSLSVAWYGIIIAIGFALALVYGMRNAKRLGILPDKMVDVVIGGIVGGIVGARLYYVIFSWKEYQDNLLDIFRIWNGGLAIYGGLIGAITVGYFICKWRKVKFTTMLDLAAPGFLIGQGIGRWGNFVNIEAYGGNTTLPWGMWSEKIFEDYLDLSSASLTFDPSEPVHPCFLYESLWCIAGFFLIHFLVSKHRKFDGQVFLSYLAWYGLGRVFIEGLRTDSLMLGNLRVSQVLAGLMVLFSVVLILVILNRIKRTGDPEYMQLYVNTQDWQAELAQAEETARLEKEKRARKKAGLPATDSSEDTQQARSNETVAEEIESAEENISSVASENDTDETKLQANEESKPEGTETV